MNTLYYAFHIQFINKLRDTEFALHDYYVINNAPILIFYNNIPELLFY